MQFTLKWGHFFDGRGKANSFCLFPKLLTVKTQLLSKLAKFKLAFYVNKEITNNL